jgi:hypothetical protein
MLMTVVWTLLALAAAAAVLVVASVTDDRTDERGVRAYVADLRTGLRGLRARRAGDAGERPAAAVPVETTMDDLLAAAEVQDPAYVAVEDLTDTLARARDRAARSVPGLPRR